MATQSPDAKHVRAYARQRGHDIGDRGLIPEHLWQMWAEAGYPLAAGGTKPEGWSPAPRNANGNRAVRVSGRRPKSPAAVPRDPAIPVVVRGFSQPVDAEEEREDEPTHEVDLVVSGKATVLTLREAEWFNHTKRLYVDGNQFTDVADLQDLDRLLIMELQVFRLGQWLSRNEDYRGDRIDIALYQKQLKDLSAEIARLKDAMGLSKRARDASAVSVAEKWNDVLRRAKKWNYHRVNQLREALLLMNQLSTIVGTFDRSDEEERRKLGYTSEHEILDWVRTDMLPRYHAVDEHFRTHEQSTWAKD